MEELEKASRMVMSESVRRGVVATAQNLCMWPPDPPPASVAEGDCSYEDTSAPMDAIAQRAWNDESQRARRGGAEGLERRVLTASYLVDFATRAGAPLPPVPETFP
ncbi:unnamed protein product [Prorocentrum cordatum]|uniref:Uncharacterized protein n=1 Tax=Prorocentrum cordatum TaxID=2364126 RepID=A0ABN9VFF2_9DINO|nr:unnamed protein product [Polarella glacialis]